MIYEGPIGVYTTDYVESYYKVSLPFPKEDRKVKTGIVWSYNVDKLIKLPEYVDVMLGHMLKNVVGAALRKQGLIRSACDNEFKLKVEKSKEDHIDTIFIFEGENLLVRLERE